MTLLRCTTTDAFMVVDLPNSTAASGIVRCAKKILVDGAELLARSVTYGYASLGIAASGASAGINASGDGRDEAVNAFVAEVASLAEGTSLSLTAGKGTTVEELVSLRGSGPDPVDHDSLIARSSVAAAATHRGTLEGATVAVEAVGNRSEVVASAFAAAGATVVASGDPQDEVDIWCAGSKVGLIDHDLAASVGCSTIVPIGPLPVTARGRAVALRRGIDVLADFITTSGPLLATVGLADDIEQRVTAATQAARDDEHGPLLAACLAAERFLATWQDDLPFGRPLA